MIIVKMEFISDYVEIWSLSVIMLKMASFSNLKFENAIKQTRTLVAPQRGKTSNNKIGATVQLLAIP